MWQKGDLSKLITTSYTSGTGVIRPCLYSDLDTSVQISIKLYTSRNVMGNTLKATAKWRGHIHVWEYDAIFTSPLTPRRVAKPLY